MMLGGTSLRTARALFRASSGAHVLSHPVKGIIQDAPPKKWILRGIMNKKQKTKTLLIAECITRRSWFVPPTNSRAQSQPRDLMCWDEPCQIVPKVSGTENQISYKDRAEI